MRWKLAVFLGTGALVGALGAAPPEPTPEVIKAALGKAIPLLEKSVEEYPRQRTCFSCHNQAVPAMALSLARERGFAVGEGTLAAIAEHTAADLESALDDYKQGKGQPGGVERAGYALFTLEIAGHARDDVTDAVTEYLLGAQKDRDHWRNQSNRPPSEASDFTSSALAVRGLRTFGTAGQADRIGKRVDDVRQWLKTARVRDTEDRVFRLFALQAATAPAEAIKSAAADLLKTQNDDGGWAQLDGQPSDAYATGSALVALHQAGGLATDDPAYQGGLAALLQSQRADGSWLVVSRSKPFQPYFESGFPHGKDQFISIAGSGWAASALLLALPRP